MITMIFETSSDRASGTSSAISPGILPRVPTRIPPSFQRFPQNLTRIFSGISPRVVSGNLPEIFQAIYRDILSEIPPENLRIHLGKTL